MKHKKRAFQFRFSLGGGLRRLLLLLILGMGLGLTGCGSGEKSGAAEGAASSQDAASADASSESGETSGIQAQAGEALRFRILNTGKSDCTVFARGSSAILIDTADQDDYSHITQVLGELGVEKIEAILLSHYDKDHIGSAAFLLQDYPVGVVYGPDHSENSDEYNNLVKAVQKYGVEFNKLEPASEKTLEFGDASFLMEAPAEAIYEDDNDYTVIVTVSCGEEDYLFLGDALKTRLKEFTPKASYALVKTPHHGDYFKVLGELIEQTQIGCAVICAEENGDTLEEKLTDALAAKGIEPLYTWNGDILFETEPFGFTQSGS